MIWRGIQYSKVYRVEQNSITSLILKISGTEMELTMKMDATETAVDSEMGLDV